ncbi:YcxB family protein [Saccharopolyspora sp. NPDC000995]
MSFEVPYDAQQLRRTIRFLVRNHLMLIRILGGLLALLGLLLVVLDPSEPFGYTAVVGGLLLVLAIGPILVAVAMRMQAAAIKQGFRLVLNDEWMQISYPLCESRLWWAGLGRAVETPEVWYVMFGKAQAVVVPKGVMTPQQQAEFAAFVVRLRPATA